MIVSCSYSVMTLFARAFSKWGQLHIEDALLTAAYVSYESGCTMVGTMAVKRGPLTRAEGICTCQLGLVRPLHT